MKAFSKEDGQVGYRNEVVHAHPPREQVGIPKEAVGALPRGCACAALLVGALKGPDFFTPHTKFQVLFTHRQGGKSTIFE